MEIAKAKHTPYSSVTALITIPFVFVLLTSAIAYFAFIRVAKPYFEVISLFVSDRAAHTTPHRNLLASAKGAIPEPLPDVSAIPVSSVTMPNPGDLYGRLTIEGTDIDAPVYWDDTAVQLNSGIGTYSGGWLPGFGRTIMMAGHRDSWLKGLGDAEIGGIITVETHYGTYEYEITDIATHHMTDDSAYDFSRQDENIIIYTCYPFDYVGRASERFFVYGQLLSGLQVDRSS